ncbi:GTPase Era [Plasticicumulans acidivorans]|uniref:GTPase Era n=1 Tax=Plasticicumulans acidivorans TaxID=886464 RepID=A0A317MXW3_9GAMM|nr:GTPase Era [Plasticicumulans acidivorans]PWV63368.1 GTP-binding protein Era [Plasticicumulans acidivorans]
MTETPPVSGQSTRAGYVALLGRPNVGKSTLLNRLLAFKLSITSPKPQTTRHTILGIQTLEHTQIVYVDTPGLHLGGKKAMNRYMNRAAGNVLGFVDVVVFLVEALRWTDEDEAVLQRLEGYTGPVVLAVNKVDRIKDKAQLLPFLQQMAGKRTFAAVLPISAQKGTNAAELETELAGLLPEHEFFFDEDQITTASKRFLAAELIREKLTRVLDAELPYALTVEIEKFEVEGRLNRINAVIWVERKGQKAIVIGDKGSILREAGRLARIDMEKIFDAKVYLETWVKVREGWSDDERALRSLGFQESDDSV